MTSKVLYNNNNIKIICKKYKDYIIDDNLYNILNIDKNYSNIIHIPMIDDIIIYINDNIYNINIKDLKNDNLILNNNFFKILSIKKSKKFIYRDIIIHTDNNYIIIQLYNLINNYNITHGGYIIYDKENLAYNTNCVNISKNLD